MKRLALLLLAAALCLTGCVQPPPARAADGAAWSGDWVNIGNVVGVDTPEGLDLRENQDVLAQQGMYYATWSAGEPEPFVNADGDDAVLYDAQVYLLLAGYGEAEKAQDRCGELLELAASRYAVEDEGEAVCNGQAFTVLSYAYRSEENPYERGASAFGVYRNYAVSVEASCRGEGDPLELLEAFLERCHYAA